MSAPGMTDDGLLRLDLKVFVAAKPISLILVEKNSHGLRLLRHDGRLQVSGEYRVALGENFGRKEKEGDEKTPEGIYFITKKYIDHKVTVFGTRAFHLNYPNVFDTLENRDGNGIYIHGTNKPLRFNSTNGCVTLNDHDLAGLADYLKVGTMPIVIVSSLLELKTNSAALPDLTANNFKIAKKLLIPEGDNSKIKFNNLYLLRVDGQTVVAGEYGENGGSDNFAASYIKFYPKRGWAVLERVPNFLLGDSALKESIPTAKSEFFPAKVLSRPQLKIGEKFKIDDPDIWSWPPSAKDVYLDWYRDSWRHRQKLQHNKAVPAKKEIGVDRAEKSYWLIYILFSACLIMAGVLIYVILRWRKSSSDVVRENSYENTVVVGDRAEKIVIDNAICQRQMVKIQNDVKFLKDALQVLSTHLEETRLMDKQELQTRIEDLEGSLQAKQAEIEQLITEKSALQLKGISHLSGQVEELAVMRQDLQASQEKLDESRQDLERLPMLEQMLAAEQEKNRELAMKNATLKSSVSGESAALQAEISQLKDELVVMKEKLRTSELEQKGLEDKIAAGEISTSELDELRAVIAEERQRNSILNEKLAGFISAEEELKGKETSLQNETAQLREELGVMKERLRASELEQKALEEKIAAGEISISQAEEMRHAIAEEQQKNNLLSEKLADFASIEVDLKDAEASLQNEIAQLREELGVMKEKVRVSDNERQSLKNQIATDENSSLQEDEMRRLIAEEQHEKSILLEKLTHLSQIETELREELANSRQQNSDLSERVENLAISHGDLSRTGEETTAKLVALQKELDLAQQEISDLTIKNKRNDDLDDLLLARQVEVTKLTNDLQEFRERTTEQHKADVAALRIQLENLREELMEEREIRLEAEQKLAELIALGDEEERRRNELPTEAIAEVAERELEAGDVEVETPEIIDTVTPEEFTRPLRPSPTGEVITPEIKGDSDLLPQDIMAKWLNS